MTREEKKAAVADLKETFENNQFFYFTDSSSLTVGQINKLRRLCFEKGVTMRVIKNTLAKKAFEQLPEENGYAALYDSLKGPTAVLTSSSANQPAKVIKEFRGQNDRPILKAAYIDKDIFIGDGQLDVLATLKSKEDLIGDVILLLQSPMKNLLGALQSGENSISGLLKALEQRAEE